MIERERHTHSHRTGKLGTKSTLKLSVKFLPSPNDDTPSFTLSAFRSQEAPTHRRAVTGQNLAQGQSSKRSAAQDAMCSIMSRCLCMMIRCVDATHQSLFCPPSIYKTTSRRLSLSVLFSYSLSLFLPVADFMAICLSLSGYPSLQHDLLFAHI